MPDHQTTCPGCRRPLHVPAEAVGRTAHCPHCRTAFKLPANPDGTPGPPRRALVVNLPRQLLVPAFGLLMLGFAGTLVNGYLSVMFAVRPGFEMDYARGRVSEVRSAEVMSGAMRPPSDYDHAPLAAVMGVAAADLAGTAEKDRKSEELARAWAPSVAPLHQLSAAVSFVVLLGGVAILRGRGYYLALAGCVAAMVNVNHLCCLPGAVAGVWGVFALVRDDVRPHFGRSASPRG